MRGAVDANNVLSQVIATGRVTRSTTCTTVQKTYPNFRDSLLLLVTVLLRESSGPGRPVLQAATDAAMSQRQCHMPCSLAAALACCLLLLMLSGNNAQEAAKAAGEPEFELVMNEPEAIIDKQPCRRPALAALTGMWRSLLCSSEWHPCWSRLCAAVNTALVALPDWVLRRTGGGTSWGTRPTRRRNAGRVAGTPCHSVPAPSYSSDSLGISAPAHAHRSTIQSPGTAMHGAGRRRGATHTSGAMKAQASWCAWTCMGTASCTRAASCARSRP